MYPTPGYPIYESMIKFLGGVPVPYQYTYALFELTISCFNDTDSALMSQ